MMYPCLPDDEPPDVASPPCTVTVFVVVFVPPQAATPSASTQQPAIETRSRMRDIRYLPLWFELVDPVVATISTAPPVAAAGRLRGRSSPWSPAGSPWKGRAASSG